MNMLKLGQYVKGDSFVHKLDPRTKFIYCIFIVSSTLINSNGFILLLNAFTLVLAILLAEIDIFKLISRMKSLLLLITCTFLFQFMLTKGEPLFYIWKIDFTKQGLWVGMLTAFRLLAIYLCSCILTMTTSPMKLNSGLERLFSPLAKYIPVNQLAMIISISLRFIPTILEETENIKLAQKSRGAQFESGNLIVKLKSVSAVLIPILAASMQRASDLAVAMESRCYTCQSSSTLIAHFQYKRADKIIIGVVLLNLLLCFIMR